MNEHAQAGTRDLFQAEYGHFIAGEWVGANGGKLIDQINPATGAVLASIQAGTAQDAIAAVDAASAALPGWSATSSEERQDIMVEIARRLKARAGDFAMMESLNNGKTITEATYWDIPMATGSFSYFAGAAHTLKGETLDFPDAVCLTHREPIGVCAQITPWNVPLVMAAAKIAPAIVSGNTVVLKPAESTCLAVLEFIREIADLLPPGVVNVITGYGSEIGEPLVTHPAVRKVAFTGSTATGRHIMRYASQNIIPQTLELGGKSAQIVCASADVDAAVEGAVMSTVFNKGEVCLAGSRVFVHASIKEEFMEKLARAMKGIRIGNPLDPATQLGAQASRQHYDKIVKYLQIAIDEGAVPVSGGEIAHVDGLESGLFIQPTILDKVTPQMRVAREEIFGPVTSILTWENEAEVIAMANDSEYGLGGGLWSRDLAQVHRMTRAMQTGTIWVNRYYNVKMGTALGGYKQSGFGREFAHDILDAYTITKSVVINLNEGKLGVFG